MNCNTGGLRFNRKASNENERRMFQSWWNELTRLYGTHIDYFTYDYSLTAHNYFYGEHTQAPFSGPTPMIMLAQFNNDSLLLSKFGIRTDADVTLIVPILAFRTAFNSNSAEPKAGDLIRFTELGWDRPGGVDDINTFTTAPTSCDAIAANDPLNGVCTSVNPISTTDCLTDQRYYSSYDDSATFERLLRGGAIYEITERRDENMSQNYNMLQGHYVWIIHAKRFDYSYQPNAPREPGHDQLSEETLYGKLSGGTNYPEQSKKYTQNVTEASDDIWNYDDNPDSNDSVYGRY